MQSVYSTALANWGIRHSLGRVFFLCRDSVSVFYSPNQLGHLYEFEDLISLQEKCEKINENNEYLQNNSFTTNNKINFF